MSKMRTVNTKFWDDSYIVALDPSEKLLYLYFLTNSLTELSGIYEIPLRRIAFDTGFEKDMVSKILKRFEHDEKMFYVEGWVIIQNFLKNQAINPSIKHGMERSLANLPPKVCEFLQADPRLSPVRYTLLNFNLTLPNLTLLNLTLPEKLRSKKKEIQVEVLEKPAVNKLLGIFYKINPTLNFANKTQRSCSERLIAKLGEDKAVKTAEAAVAVFGRQFAPVITTPVQLENKLAELISFYKRSEATAVVEI